MKHIFTIHSPITFFCAYEVIDHEAIDEKDVIFLCSNYKPPFDFGKIINSFAELKTSFLSKIIQFNLVKNYDSYIDYITGEQEFIAYIDLVHYYQKILISHKKCLAFNFIEEGTASYVKPRNLSDLTHIERHSNFRYRHIKGKLKSVIRVLRGFNLKILSIPYYANAFSFLENIKFYTFSESAYPGIPDEKRIILRASADNIHFQEYCPLYKALIFIEESFHKAYAISEKNYIEALKKTIDIVKERFDNREIHVKMRPGSDRQNSILLDQLNKNEINYTIFSDSTLIEPLLIKSKDCVLIGTVSSVLFYGAIFGHQSFSNFKLIKNKPVTVFNSFNMYWNKVNLIT